MNLVKGAALGAAIVYFFDPDRGKTRRARLRDQVLSTIRRSNHFLDTARRDLAHRAQGMKAEARSALERDAAPDETVVERIRSKLGRYVSHPKAIDVDFHDGIATLSGIILADEVDNLITAVASVRGVTAVDNELEPHEQAGRISALQGGRMRGGDPMELMQKHWAPSTRLLIGAAGVSLMFQCLQRRTPGALLLGTLGLAMTARSATNSSVTRLLGVGEQADDVQEYEYLLAEELDGSH